MSLGWRVFALAMVNGVAYLVDKETVSYGDGISEEKGKPLYLIGAGAGFLMMIGGAIMAEPAKGEIKLLEEEGARLGYLTAGIAPLRGGIVISVRYCF